jgi:hypothetical protein
MSASTSGAALAAATLALAACGGGGDEQAAPKPTTYAAHGITVTLPAGWQRAAHSLTPDLVEPREVVAAGTFPLRYRATGCSHMPGSALEDLGPRDAFVTLQERPRHGSSTGFPARPEDFSQRLRGGHAGSDAVDCVPKARFTDHWFTFSDAGRRFHVLVAFGPRTTAATRGEAAQILDDLRISDPG